MEIDKIPRNRKGWSDVQDSAPRPAENRPGPSQLVPGAFSPPREQEDDSLPIPPISPTPSEMEIERGLDYSETLTEKICQDGGAPLLSFLLTKAISPIAAVTTDPKTWGLKDVSRLPEFERHEWIEACQRELEALQRRDVFELVQRPRGRKVIKNRWVFDVKTDGRKQARLVAKGFSQVEGLNYDQVFSPIVRFETVRLMLSMAALEKWVISGLDVKNAFLYGKLDEEIYMEQPEGFRVPGHEHMVVRLKRALYGLKQAGLAWW